MLFQSLLLLLLFLLVIALEVTSFYWISKHGVVSGPSHSLSGNAVKPLPRPVPMPRDSSHTLSLARRKLDQTPLELSEENVQLVLDEARVELGAVFGYEERSKEVGITGTIEFVELDGPNVIISLHGRFWHATDTVLARVDSFVRQRIPEVVAVLLDRSKSHIIDDNRLNSDEDLMKKKRRLF